MTELSEYKAAVIAIARSLESCSQFIGLIDKCENQMDLLDLIFLERVEIQEQIERQIEDRTINLDRIIDWIKRVEASDEDKEAIFEELHYMPPTDQLVNALAGNNLLNSMKIELLIDMIDQLPIAEMEALHNRYRWNNASASQRQIAV